MNASGAEHVFLLPDLGEGLTEVEILEWRVAVGDVVTVDQVVVEVETAKAAVDVPVPIAGTVVRLHGAPGEVVSVGEPLIAVARPDEQYREEERAGSGNVLIGYGTAEARPSRRRPSRNGKAPTPSPVSTSTATPARASTSAPPAAGGAGAPGRDEVTRVISPVVRRLAKDHGIDVSALTPSGPGGVVLRRDVEAAIATMSTPHAEAATRAEAASRATTVPQAGAALREEVAPGVGADGVERVPLRGMRRAAAEKLARSRREIPDATTWVDVDATALAELKRELAEASPDAGIGLLALFARICVAGLRRYPELNAYVDTEREEIVRLPGINLGFAAQTERGLVVPVVRDVQRLTLAELAAALRERTEQARDGALGPKELTGGTFTLNNYGVFGVDGSTPIINHPEAAMLGVGRVFERPWGVDGEIRLRKITQLSFTFDHRVCDGGVAGGFLRFVADCVERPAVLLTHL
ncbi:dihydrolipoamide acetyltransferase family protein [Spirillospora sp. CA-294931]|uniref:dihydrolipoamide acetyltransferase family protein n=1 Tax=Spirillospora sp. CA-294931 TaxID=3240042 RepID=UPI003D8C4A82